ncbi:energy-coupling factor transport system ATP-binding protein [Orenia metallireducens]|uniref:Energy-coupling factor transporter ATP-binding protein EcfA2 n=1 Tax=Orenia metallireducens TaxID=1413210 RepID=A0A285HAP2_9FIRM|nr:energy-coupling factor transporter ATPase [Orenia metallireducens]PRX26234.1 energy-coupling factor transport system ATP-binding protein [Orenia metallireducens]SNY31721.1 energy-coupling factor transport system ATP-binding protein [Orenia metallireducens]
MLLEVRNLSHNYDVELNPNNYILKDINFKVAKGEFIGLIGHTGSGKSTLVQTLNGLIRPTEGKIMINNQDITKTKKLKEIRKKVGLVFQYPEHQLFEETIFADVAFGPKNLGLKDKEIEERVKKALKLVNLDFEEFKDRSPFRLSGGQQRRVAIAGVLAMEPEILILDEPTAGLDPKARKELIKEIIDLKDKFGLTIILISHRMEEVAQLADRVLVLEKGKLVLEGAPSYVFDHDQLLESIGLGIPQVTKIMKNLKQKLNNLEITTDIFTVEEAKEEILKLMRG